MIRIVYLTRAIRWVL